MAPVQGAGLFPGLFAHTARVSPVGRGGARWGEDHARIRLSCKPLVFRKEEEFATTGVLGQ